MPGKLVFWLVFFMAITMAVDTLGISAISDVPAQSVAYVPQVIATIFIPVLANVVAGIVRGATGSGIAGSVAQYGIIVFATFAALTRLGIAEELIAPASLILLGGVTFGLGGQDVAGRTVERSGEARRQIQQQQDKRQDEEHSSAALGTEDDSERPDGRRLRR